MFPSQAHPRAHQGPPASRCGHRRYSNIGCRGTFRVEVGAIVGREAPIPVIRSLH